MGSGGWGKVWGRLGKGSGEGLRGWVRGFKRGLVRFQVLVCVHDGFLCPGCGLHANGRCLVGNAMCAGQAQRVHTHVSPLIIFRASLLA